MPTVGRDGDGFTATRWPRTLLTRAACTASTFACCLSTRDLAAPYVPGLISWAAADSDPYRRALTRWSQR